MKGHLHYYRLSCRPGRAAVLLLLGVMSAAGILEQFNWQVLPPLCLLPMAIFSGISIVSLVQSLRAPCSLSAGSGLAAASSRNFLPAIGTRYKLSLYLVLLSISLTVRIDYPAWLSRRTDDSQLTKHNWVVMEAALKNTAYGQRCLMVAQKNAGIKILIEGDAQAIQQPGTVFRLAADIQPLNQKVVYRPAAYWSEGVFYYVRISHERQLILQADHQTSLKLSLRQNMEKMRYWLARAYISILGQQNGNLAAAMLIGWDQGLSEADKEIFRLAGLSHLLVVSGSNVTMLLQLLTPQTGLWPFRGRRIRVLQILLIISYGYLCAFDPSVSRAVAAQILGLTAVLLRRPYNQTDLTAKSALLTLLLAPSLAWSWGFRMSLSISILLTIVQKRGRLNRRCRPEPGSMTERLMWRFNLPLGSYRFINLLTETLRAQLIAAVAIIPFETAFAAEVSALSGLINLIAIPLAEVLSVYLFILVPWIGSAAAIPPLCLLLQRSLGAGLNLLQCLAAQAGRYPELLFRHDSQLQTAAFAGLIIIVAVACLDWLRVNPAVMDAQILC